MTLNSFIKSQITDTGTPQFSWSDWKCREYYMWNHDEGFLDGASDAAALGLMLACSSWINHRFAPLLDDPMPIYAQRAGWAYMLEPEACFYFEPHDDLWRGPIRAPAAVSAVVTMDALFCRDADPEVRLRTHWMANLARYVLHDDAKRFDAWYEWACEMLPRVHPRSEMPELGIFDIPDRFQPVVGREVFDPENGTYDPAQARNDVMNYVLSGDRNNPFIDWSELSA